MVKMEKGIMLVSELIEELKKFESSLQVRLYVPGDDTYLMPVDIVRLDYYKLGDEKVDFVFIGD